MTELDLVALAAMDPRIAANAPNETAHGRARLQRWIDAGQPAADPARLVFAGDDSVRAVLVATIERLPSPIQWHAIEWVVFREVGRSAIGWMHTARPRRDPLGDIAHEIMLLGSMSDDELPALIGHETAHSWHARIDTERWPLPPMSSVERRARRISLGRDMGIDEEQLAQMDADLETLADRTSRAWGLPSTLRPLEQLRRARANISEAAELVADIERACDIGGTP